MIATTPLKLDKTDTLEFSRILDVSHLKSGRRYPAELTANEDERHALAKRFGVIGLNDVSVSLVVDCFDCPNEIRVFGNLKAVVEQKCIATLMPFQRNIETSVEFRCRNAAASEEEEDSISLDQSEPIIDDKVDIGEVIAQLLSLEIDPYPRSPQALAEEESFSGANSGAFTNFQKPFENLASLLKSENK